MIARAAVVARAREYLGTPFHHQGRLKGIGIDCAGLIVCVARDLGIALADQAGYGRLPDGVMLRAVCDAQALRIEPASATEGDILLMRFRDDPQHLAILTAEATLIHSYWDVSRVVEQRLDDLWRARICGAYRLPGVG